MKSAPSFNVQIWMAGDLAQAKQVCCEYCFAVGLCVTVTATDYVYTGGGQSGFVVGLINYPRFPKELTAILITARELAHMLMVRLCQESYTITGPEISEWYSRRKEESV